MPRSLTHGRIEVVAITPMKATSINAPNQKKTRLSTPSFSSKPETRRRASARSASVASLEIPNILAPSHNVATVVIST